jgi:hypothetical protein
MTRAHDRILALVVGGGLAVILTICSALNVAGWTVGTAHRSEHRVLRGDLQQVRIDGGSGDVTLVPTSGRNVVVDSRAEGTLWLPKLDTRIDGDRVTVNGHCHVVVFGSCGATFVVHVPAGVAVRVRASSGDVRASGLSGPVALETSSGDVAGTELSAAVVSAHADSGDVDVDLVSAPRSVSASASSGDVSITVPRGDEAYDAQVESSFGDRHVGVRTDPGSARRLRAVTSAGDVTIGYR